MLCFYVQMIIQCQLYGKKRLTSFTHVVKALCMWCEAEHSVATLSRRYASVLPVSISHCPPTSPSTALAPSSPLPPLSSPPLYLPPKPSPQSVLPSPPSSTPPHHHHHDLPNPRHLCLRPSTLHHPTLISFPPSHQNLKRHHNHCLSLSLLLWLSRQYI